MNDNYRPDFGYADFAPHFTAEFFNAEEWASVFNASGARYVVLTSKHHEGYALWPSAYSWNWNSMDVGPKRDLVGELADAVRNATPHIHFGLYHSLYEWFNPLFQRDASNFYQTDDFVQRKVMPELYDLVARYVPEIIWSDGDWDAPAVYWHSKEFLAWLFNDTPLNETVVVNDRWGTGVICNHGTFYTCTDRYSPGVLQPHKWENAMTLDRKSWGYRREAATSDYLTIHELLTELARTISCGGNLLVNIGPTSSGRLPPIMEERLLQLGTWLHINGDAVYGTQPWVYQNDTITPGIWYTTKDDTVFAIVLEWPEEEILVMNSVTASGGSRVRMLGYQGGTLEFSMAEYGMEVAFPLMSKVESQWVWVLELEGVEPTPF
ncbi:Tissue alpha-L-fucosidase [Halocaridina rubra]|uniref:Putative alpha-L-fucosidase n=1 Tax=Halocaridina rubra TaxID=373956 RepID=A0AAN8WIQ6_HALRR